MTFYVGQKVVRIGQLDDGHEIDPRVYKVKYSFPALNEVCTIRSINHWPKYTLLTFVEHDNSHLIRAFGCQLEPGFDAEYFRPVVERKTDTGFQILEEILRNTKAPVTDDCFHASLDRGRQ